MRPIDDKFFGQGSDRFAVRFHNGNAIVDGFIVSQRGTSTYMVSDGSVKRKIRLVRDTSMANVLAGYAAPGGSYPLSAFTGMGTILIRDGSAIRFATRISANRIDTTAGVSLTWDNGDSTTVIVSTQGNPVLVGSDNIEETGELSDGIVVAGAR